MINYIYGQGITFYTDSSFNGFGAWCGNDWVPGYFGSSLEPAGLERLNKDHGHWLNIALKDPQKNLNILELIPV